MTTHWADALQLRPEVTARRGHAHGLQMSLYEVVYQTSDVPYRDPSYWCDITEPTVKLVEFMAGIRCQLAGAGEAGKLNLPGGGDSLIHLDQGMGGGKSHALVGLWHMATNGPVFLGSDIGQAVDAAAQRRAGGDVSVGEVRTVVLCADNFSPGIPRPEFGPATNLHQRFLWSLFAGDRTMYDRHVAAGSDKAALKDALAAVDQPVLILLDEVMDYALLLAAPENRDAIPAEQAFLNALTEVVNEAIGVAAVVVMIRSDLDEGGYQGPASEFRDYLAHRLERNGTSDAVNEPQDFAAIIRRRIFTRPTEALPTAEVGKDWESAASSAWRNNVFDKLPGSAHLAGFTERVERSYPFHPDLLHLIEHDWTQHAGFQRVRSTVEVFAATSYFWTQEHAAGRWVPALIGVGDIPLHVAADEVLASGLLHGNERQVVGMRQVAEKDVTNRDRSDGQAVLVDQRVSEGRPWSSVQPQPAVRLSTALWMYSIATRAQAKRGATKAELLAAVYVPESAFEFSDAEEIFNVLVDPEDDRSLGAIDTLAGGGGSTPTRFVFSTTQNKLSFQKNALNRTTPEHSYDLIWERVSTLATKGSGFDQVLLIDDSEGGADLKDAFREVDQRRSNRLVVLHPKRWTLLNGRDAQTRADIEAVLGVGPSQLAVDFAASCVIACVNTQRRDPMVKKAKNAFAWRLAASEIDRDSDLHAEMSGEARRALDALDGEIKRAFQHLAYLVRTEAGLAVDFPRFEDDTKTALSGNDVWEELARRGDAVQAAAGLAGSYLHKLLDLSRRPFTLGEVVEKFWRDPVFPMIPREETARRAIFEALRADEDGIEWELVTAAGEPLVVRAPEELAINAQDQMLRLKQPSVESEAAGNDNSAPGAAPELATSTGAPSATSPEVPAEPVVYRVHSLGAPSRSLTDSEYRGQLYQLLIKIADAVDDGSVQVASLKIELNAAAGSLNAVKARADAANATWSESDEDF